MGMFDTIRAILRCPVCGSVQERWIQSKKGPCLMLNLEVGDTIEPFFYGDYWLEEEWHCDECEERLPKEERWQHWRKVFIHCLNGLILEVAADKPQESKLPDWELIHKLSRDRQRFRQTLKIVRNSVLDFKERRGAGEKKRHPLLDFGPKTTDELLEKIVDDVERAGRGEPPGWF
jgi:hypothetical protein